jgi:hypothetical protein
MRTVITQSSNAATKLKPFAFSSRASRLRGESPAPDSPRSREEREDFAKKNPFLPAKDFGLVVQETNSEGSVNAELQTARIIDYNL